VKFLAIHDIKFAKTVMDEVEKDLADGPVLVDVSRSAVDAFIAEARRRRLLFTPVEARDDSILFSVSVPENHLPIDPSVDEVSHLITHDIIIYAVKHGRAVGQGRVEDPRSLIGLLREHVLAGRSIILLYGHVGWGVVVIGNNTIRAVMYNTYTVMWRREALREIFMTGPYDYVVVRLPASSSHQSSP